MEIPLRVVGDVLVLANRRRDGPPGVTARTRAGGRARRDHRSLGSSQGSPSPKDRHREPVPLDGVPEHRRHRAGVPGVRPMAQLRSAFVRPSRSVPLLAVVALAGCSVVAPASLGPRTAPTVPSGPAAAASSLPGAAAAVRHTPRDPPRVGWQVSCRLARRAVAAPWRAGCRRVLPLDDGDRRVDDRLSRDRRPDRRRRQRTSSTGVGPSCSGRDRPAARPDDGRRQAHAVGRRGLRRRAESLRGHRHRCCDRDGNVRPARPLRVRCARRTGRSAT